MERTPPERTVLAGNWLAVIEAAESTNALNWIEKQLRIKGLSDDKSLKAAMRKRRKAVTLAERRSPF